MIIKKGKISMNQALVILLLAVSSSGLRILPVFATSISHEAAWLGTFIAVIPLIPLIYIYQKIFNKYPAMSLDNVYDVFFGKFIGKIIVVFYFFWLLLTFVIYVRYFCERFLTTILIDTPMEFMLVVMLGFIFYVLRNNIEALSRMCEFFFLIFIFIYAAIFFVTLPQIKLSNLYPVTLYDMPKVLTSSIYGISLATYFTYIFFFAKDISNKEDIKKYGIIFIVFCIILALSLMVTVIGIIGPMVTPKFPIPYFTVIKSIEILGTVERIEPIIIAIWVVTDSIIIGFFGHILLRLMKNIFGIKDKKPFVVPLLLFTYVGAFYLVNNKIELLDFSKNVGLIVNLIFTFVIPVVAFFVGKIRKLV